MLVLGSCPMKTKITQSLDGFRLQIFTFTSPPGFDFYHLSLAAGCDLHYTFIAVRPTISSTHWIVICLADLWTRTLTLS